ncbi:MAG: DUF4837 family protein [Bacteroidales bacterium]|nr:DUF4837 family protein [Bacteroidales bacterium]
MNIHSRHTTLWLLILCLLTLGAPACHHPQDNAADDTNQPSASSSTTQRKRSSGKTLELLVAADREVYAGATRHLIDSLFAHPQVALPQPEPILDVRNIPLSSFHNTEMFQVHRNVLVCDVNPTNPDKVYRYIDRYAAPQVVYDIAASSRRTLDSLLAACADRFLADLYDCEHRRLIHVYTDFRTEQGLGVSQRVARKTGVELVIPNEFTIATLENNFAWVRKQAKDFDLHLIVNREPYVALSGAEAGRNRFDEDIILNHLDTLLKQRVPGPTEGSYMGTERREYFFSRTLTLDSNYCVETRGLWRLHNDFMGGPFVCYTILSPGGREIVTILGFVYAPRHNKRDYLMQIESLCLSARLPHPAAPQS